MKVLRDPFLAAMECKIMFLKHKTPAKISLYITNLNPMPCYKQTLQQIFGQSLGLINRSSPTALQFLVQQLHFMSLIEQEPNFVDASPSERKSIGPINMDARGTPGA